jgi:hypothetical protein
MIKDDGHIVWRRSMTENAPKDNSSNQQLNDVLKAMGIEECSEAAQTEMIRKYNCSVAKLIPKNGHNPPMLEEVLQVMKEWSPKTDLICLHVRWAKQSKRNFHLDSISTLLTVSNQCGYHPLAFLTNAKTLVVHPRTRMKARGKFGVKFALITRTSKKDKVDGEKISRQFAGLALTLAMLQSTAVGCRGNIGQVGMRQKEARTPSLISLPNQNDSDQPPVDIHGIPLVEFHKDSSFHNRLWLNIGHRWMALRLVEHLFKPHIKPWNPQDALNYTFRMHSGVGGTRYDFLNPMVGFCLRFSDATVIAANPGCLTGVWVDPKRFSSFGDNILTQMSVEQKRDAISIVFMELQQTRSKSTYCGCYDSDKLYLMLRGFIFHFWLEKASNVNDGLLLSVVNSLSNKDWQSLQKKRKKKGLPDEQLEVSPKKKMITHPSIDPLSFDTLYQLVKRRKAIRDGESFGFASLMASRRNVPSPVGGSDELPIIAKYVNPFFSFAAFRNISNKSNRKFSIFQE